MNIPMFELVGTWDEIASRLPDLTGQKLRVVIYPAEEQALRDSRPITDVLSSVAANVPVRELASLPPDFTEQLDHYIYGTPKR